MSNSNITPARIELPQGGGPMPDIHICGQCQSHFSCINQFIEHKRAACGPITPQTPTSQSSMLTSPGSTDGASPPQAPVDISSPAGGASSKRRWNTTNRGGGVNQLQRATGVEAPGATSSPRSNYTRSPRAKQQNTDGTVPSGSATKPDKATNVGSKTPPTTPLSIPNHMVQMMMQYSPQKGGTGKSKTEKRYKCNNDGCTFTTAHMKDIQRHVRIHTGEKPYECSHCKRRFTRQDKLRIHLRIHTGDKPFHCSICEYKSVDGGSLKKHMRVHNDERPFKCQICDYASRNSSQLIVHLRTHTGDSPFHCQQCDMKFKINSDLKRHTMVHTGEKPFECTECEHKSSLKSNLKLHIKTNHENGSRYQCEECGYGCCTRRQLKIHSHTHATMDPIKCSECDFTCFNKAVFKRHESKHSADSPYKCQHCDFVSEHLGQVPKHVRKHHPETVIKGTVKKQRQKRQKRKTSKKSKKSDASPGLKVLSKKPFVCDICDANFMRQDSLMSHKRQHERLNAKTQEEENRESMAYAVLQLQFTGKAATKTNQNLSETTPTTAKGVGVGVAHDKSSNDELSTLLRAIESRQKSGDNSSMQTSANDNNTTQRSDTALQNESQTSEVLDVIDFSTEALSEVEVTSEETQQDARLEECGTDEIVTVEFPQQDNNKPAPQMPSSTYAPTTRSEETSTAPTGINNKTATIFELVDQQLSGTVVSEGNSQEHPCSTGLQVGQTSGQPQQMLNQQTLNTPNHYITQQMPSSGQVLPIQPQTVQLSSTTQLQVFPVQTVTNVAPKLMNFTAVTQSQPQPILIAQKQQQQQGNANPNMQTVTYTMPSGSSPSIQGQPQTDWQPIQHMAGQPYQQVYRPQIMTLALPQQQQQQQRQYIPIRPAPHVFPTSSSGQGKTMPKQ